MEFPSFIGRKMQTHIEWKVRMTGSAARLNHQDEEDLTALIVVALYNAMGGHDPSLGSEYAFGKSIVKHITLDYLKYLRADKRSRLSFVPEFGDRSGFWSRDGETDPDIAPDPSLDPWEGEWNRMDVEAMVAHLPAVYADICRYILADFDLKDIPDLIGVTDYTFRKKLMPGLKSRCRKFLEN